MIVQRIDLKRILLETSMDIAILMNATMIAIHTSSSIQSIVIVIVIAIGRHGQH